ncbi:MAG: tetratricopeptide repeat protein, partial [Chloroflexota bacterium]
ANLKEAEVLAARLVDRPRLSQVLYWLGRLNYGVAKHDVGIEYAHKALELADKLGDEALQAPPVNLLGRAHFLRGEAEKASKLLARNVRQMRALGNRIEEATASGFLGMCYGMLGRFAQAIEVCDSGIQIAEGIEHPPTLAACLQYRGQVRSWRGDRGSLEDYGRALELAEKGGDVFRAYIIRANRGGWGHLLLGEYGPAIEDLTRALSLAERLGVRFFVGAWNGGLAEAHLGIGNVVEALRLAREGLRIANESGSPWEQLIAFRTLAQALLAQDPPDVPGAEEAMAAALSIQDKIDMKWESAQSLLVYGRVLGAKGEGERAREVLARAGRLFEEMEVAWGTERVERALRDL